MTKSRHAGRLAEQAPPRVRVAPAKTRANSWEDVADLSRSFGLVLFPWQEAVLVAAMGERSDGSWSAKRVGLSVPRQNGKSQLLVARALAGALLFGEKKIVISAHQQDTARETFNKFVELIENCPALESRVKQVMNALNREFIKFHNGAVIQFKARSAGGTRGFSCDCLMLDEAQILSRRAWASINSTMSARENPQIWLTGTPPTPDDDGAVFGSVRAAAIKGASGTVAYLEWSADPTADPSLTDTRAAANPAWHELINHEVVEGEFETYTVDQFAIERLGIWPEAAVGAVIDVEAWNACLDVEAEIVGDPVFVLDASPMLSSVGIVAAGATADGRVGLEVTGDGTTLDYAEGYEWVFTRPWAGRRVWLVEGSAAMALRTRLEAAGALVEALPRTDYARACVSFAAGVSARRYAHRGQPDLTRHVLAGAKRSVDEGLWVWGRTRSASDICLAVAATVAAELVASAPSVYESRGPLFI